MTLGGSALPALPALPAPAQRRGNSGPSETSQLWMKTISKTQVHSPCQVCAVLLYVLRELLVKRHPTVVRFRARVLRKHIGAAKD